MLSDCVWMKSLVREFVPKAIERYFHVVLFSLVIQLPGPTCFFYRLFKTKLSQEALQSTFCIRRIDFPAGPSCLELIF